VIVDLANDCSFAFPARALHGLAEASDPDLTAVEVIGAGPTVPKAQLRPVP
jgi:hypothetical protein